MSGEVASPPVDQTSSRPRPLWARILIWIVGLAVAVAFAHLVGWDIRGWFHELWQTITTISIESSHRGDRPHDRPDLATAFAWYSILQYAYPERTKWKDILAGYAVSVALNGILPANLGTLVFLIMVTVSSG